MLVSPSVSWPFFRQLGVQREDLLMFCRLIIIFRERQAVGPKLLWMRTFEDTHYPEMAVEVLKELRKIYPHACLTMAGQEKELFDPVRRLAASYDLAEAAQFTGFLDMAGKQREFPANDIFLNTNRRDNMPVSVLEAAAFGLPVVATEVGEYLIY